MFVLKRLASKGLTTIHLSPLQHPDYIQEITQLDGFMPNDVALIQIEPVSLDSPNVGLFKMADRNMEIKGKTGYMIGFGMTEYSGKSYFDNSTVDHIIQLNKKDRMIR